MAFILDAGVYERLGEVFSSDMHFDNPGRLTVDGLANVIAAFKGFANQSLCHFITNTVLTTNTDGTVGAISKALTIRKDRSLVASEYSDVLKKVEPGWRIASRTIRRLD